jgi:hypothetical protein
VRLLRLLRKTVGSTSHGRRLRIGATALLLALVVTGTVFGASSHKPKPDNNAPGSGGGSGESPAGPGAITGTDGADSLVGTPGNDEIRGWKGNDRIDGGAGQDSLYGGAGDDQLLANDGSRDTVDCGAGNDRVDADALDAVESDCEQVNRSTGPAPQPLPDEPAPSSGPAPDPEPEPGPEPEPDPSPSGRSVVLVDRAWTCNGPVDLDLVKVTMRTAVADAIYLRTNCTGRIGRIEVNTWTRDGVKINAPSPAAHDLVIGGGYIRCHARSGGHQDGVQAMGGSRVRFVSVEINCNSTPNAQFFVQAANGGRPTGIVCDGCVLGSGAASTVLIEASAQSGVRNSVVCEGRYYDVRITSGAVNPINVGNRIVPASDSRCRA